jgi:phosphoesterase RecJ-like protein
VLRDPTACATGELVFDIITGSGEPIETAEAEALYVAIATDTGSFRFANTTARTHEICADLLRVGVDPQEMYRQLYGQVTDERLELLRRALALVEHARQLRGVEIAVLFRELPDRSTKVSLRSNGPSDVAAIARQHGGGGHEKAAGIHMKGPLDPSREAVLQSVRDSLKASGFGVAEQEALES